MKYLHRLTGILMAFCLMIVLFITSIEAVVYWTPGYFEKEYTKYEVLKDLPAMTMEDLLEVTDEMMDYQGTGMSVMEMSHRSPDGRTGAGVFQFQRNRPYGGCSGTVSGSHLHPEDMSGSVCLCPCLYGSYKG